MSCPKTSPKSSPKTMLFAMLFGLALLAAPAAASTWTVSDTLSPDDGRDVAAYGAVALPDGGTAWIEMSEPVSTWVGYVWTPQPQYWRVIRANAAGEVVWTSDEFSWQQGTLTRTVSETFFRAPQWYSPRIALLENGNLLAYDGRPSDVVMSPNPVISPARSWLRELDIDTGEVVWERDLTNWDITSVVERADGGFWASAVSNPTWVRPPYYPWYSIPAERTNIIGLNATGGVETSWRVHTDGWNQYTSSHPFSLVPVSGSDGVYWVSGWRSVGLTTYSKYPAYLAQLRPSLDRINPDTQTDQCYYPETVTTGGFGLIPCTYSLIGIVNDYGHGLPANPMIASPTSDGGVLAIYNLQYETGYRLTRMASNGTKVWSRTYQSPLSGAEIPVIEAVEAADGSILALLQDGDLIRINRLDAAGTVQQSIVIGDPTGSSTGKRLIASPTAEHPYACIVTGSTSGFGASGEDALVVCLEDLEDVLYIGAGSISLDTSTAYAAEEVTATVTLSGAAWANATYWASVIDADSGALYETWDILTNETAHTLALTHPPGNYTITLSAYCEEYEALQVLATASLTRHDVGEVAWDRDVAYMGETVGIGYSYIPDYLRYSYWIEIRGPSGLAVETHRLPTEDLLYVRAENMTEFGNYTAEIYPIRKSDETRIRGNTSVLTLSDETWIYGRISDIYLIPIPNATVEVRQPSHPDPETAARVLSGTSDAGGDYEVSGLIPRYPADITISGAGYYEHTETININVSGRIHYPARLTAIPPPPLPEIGGTAVYPPRNNPAVGYEIVLENSTSSLTEVSDAQGHYRFPPLAPDTAYTVYARNATGHRVSEEHTYALARGQTVDLLLEVIDESLLPHDVAFSADPTAGGAPLRVAFLATGEDVDSWHWDFGDGSTGAGQSASHSYGAGLWSVTLTAENYFGVREVTKEHLIIVSGGGGVPVQAPVRFVVQSYTGQPLANVTVTATPLESTGPWGWLLDLFGISGEVDINGTVLTGSTDTGGAIVLPLIRTVKYRVVVSDPGRGIETEISIYPQEDEVLITVWPQETPGPANDFVLYAEEEGSDMRVGVRYDTSDLTRITFRVTTEAGEILATRTSSAQEDDLSYVLDGSPGEVYIYGYVAEHRAAGELKQDQYIRFEAEARPWVDLAPWIPLWIYQWCAIFLLVGYSWTFGRGEIRGGMLTIPILAGILQVIGWLQIPWLLLGGALVIGYLIYTRLSEDDLRI